jgi:phage recombination protein Bet
MEIARARRLNPLLRQIHFVRRWDSGKGREVWSTQVSIDGLRAIAERTGRYDGQDEPEFVEKDGRLLCCKVRVYRKDWTRPVVGVAYWDEYVQLTKDKRPTSFWSRMPHVMLAKCAEALALRKAFPEDMSGLYVPEEMAQAERPTRHAQVTPDGEILDAQPEQDLTRALAASVAAVTDWMKWSTDHLRQIQDAKAIDELLECWAAVNEDIKRLRPPSDHVEALRLAKDDRKAELGGRGAP